jgi:hypothetical protein
VVELQLPKLAVWVRFPLPAPFIFLLTAIDVNAIVFVVPINNTPVAQGTEQRTSNPWVGGSNPSRRATFRCKKLEVGNIPAPLLITTLPKLPVFAGF